MGTSYKDSGVDVERGYAAVKLMKDSVRSTYDGNVLGDLGSFGGLYSLPTGYKNPVLVSGTDGVGTKLRYAFLSDRHTTIGIDAVAMCVNDIVSQGAKPLFFLDYFATGGLDPRKCADVVEGIAEGCRLSGASLIGGETAEMPGFYAAGEYDLAGFCVGIAEKEDIVTGADIKDGDVLLGLESSGIHSNGFSLVRRLFGEDIVELGREDKRLGGRTIDILLTPTRIYVKSILSLLEKVKVKGMAHITGGGFIENIPRMFPENIGCEIHTDSYAVPEIFRVLREKSSLPDREMYNTFNMGIGFVVCVSPGDADTAVGVLSSLGEKCHVIGRCVKGEGVTLL